MYIVTDFTRKGQHIFIREQWISLSYMSERQSYLPWLLQPYHKIRRRNTWMAQNSKASVQQWLVMISSMISICINYSMLSHTFNSMCFPNAPAYFCSTNNVGTLPPTDAQFHPNCLKSVFGSPLHMPLIVFPWLLFPFHNRFYYFLSSKLFLFVLKYFYGYYHKWYFHPIPH